MDRVGLAGHADWSIDARKRWMTLAQPQASRWLLSVQPVGDVGTLLSRLRGQADGQAVALGIDCPIGLPRAFVARHDLSSPDFPAFLRSLPGRPGFLHVCDELADVGPERPFYPRRGTAGMTRASHAAALGLDTHADLSRACDRATAERPAGAPLFWTLGANQSGRAAITAWRDLLIPALTAPHSPLLWPFDGPFRALLRPGQVAIAETYPAEALRHLGLRLRGSKRRQADRAALAAPLRAAMESLDAVPDRPLCAAIRDGFGTDAAGEDRFDSVLGCLCVLTVLAGRRSDNAPPDPWLTRWEGWVLGQTALPAA